MSRSRRVRFQPVLDVLEEKCLQSPGALRHLPMPAVDLHALKEAQARHAAKPKAHAHKAKPTPTASTRTQKAKHTQGTNAHTHRARPKQRTPKLPVFVYAPTPTPIATPSPTPSPTPIPTPIPTPTPSPSPTPSPPPPPTPTPQIPVVNQKVLTFARTSLGRQVGRGECTDLAVAAYVAAGAVPLSSLGPTGADANYVWGTLVDTATTSNRSLAGVLPGDVIQLRDVTLVHTTHYPDGSWYTTTTTAEHHTAVVESVSGSTLAVLEQNVGAAGTPDSVRRTVQHGTYNLGDLQGGTIWIYQPISAG